MARKRTLPALLLIGLWLLPSVGSWAASTQKPSGWLDLNARVTLSSPHSATLELILQSPLPEAQTQVQLNLPDGIRSEGALFWTGKLNRSQPRTLTWPLTRPDESLGAIGITVTLTDADGSRLEYQAEAAWPESQAMRKSLTQTPDGQTQYRHGEALWVVPLNEAPRR